MSGRSPLARAFLLEGNGEVSPGSQERMGHSSCVSGLGSAGFFGGRKLDCARTRRDSECWARSGIIIGLG